MRIKNDTIIKWHNLASTMFLSNAEFGALVRKIMLEDDENGLHYDNLRKDILQLLIKQEEKWLKEYEELSTLNPQMIQAYITMFGQVNHSHRAFKQLQEYYDNLDNDNDNNTSDGEKTTKKSNKGQSKNKGEQQPKQTEKPTDNIQTVSADNPNLLSKEYVFQFQIATDPDLPFQFQDFDIIAEYEKEYENNLPSEEELADNELNALETEDEKIRFLNVLFNSGNADGWKKEWYEYIEREDK